MATRILVIEDHPTNRELMHYILTKAGHTVLLAGDGLTGLAMARREQPDLIISDIHLPGMDGFALLVALAATPNLADVPVIAVTASAMSGDRENIIRAGFDDYVSKPIEPESFVSQISRHLPKRDPG